MATSGSKSVTVTKYDTLKFSWWEVEQSVVNNTTTVGWKMELIATNPGKISSSASKSWSVTVNGQTFSGTNKIGIGNNETKTLASGTCVIAHNSDGTKTFSYSFSQQFAITFNDSYIGTKSDTGTGVLDTIPRLSTIAVTARPITGTQTITVTQHSTSFKHSIKVTCGSHSLYIKSDGTTSDTEYSHNVCSISWKAPVEWANDYPNRTTVPVTFTITTYGSGTVGSSSTSVEFGIPATKPTLTNDSLTWTDPTGYNKLLGGWVQGKSQVGLTINAVGAYGATIDSVSTTFEGVTYSGKSITTNAVTSSGVVYLTITAKDSRGNETTITPGITIQEYKKPAINSFSVQRCDADGNSDPAGAYILVKFSAKVYSLNSNNSAYYYIGYKKVSDANAAEISLGGFTDPYTVNSSYIIPAAAEYSYNVYFAVDDKITIKEQSRVKSATSTVPSAKMTMSFLKKAGEVVGIAFGKVAEHEAVDFGMPVKFYGGGDVVVEQGQSNGWIYRKWQSGIMECQKTVTVSTAVTTAWGTMYVGATLMERQDYPVPFVSKPTEIASLASGANGVWLFAESSGRGVNGTHSTAIYNVCRPSAVSAAGTYYISIYATGRWK